MNIKIENPVSQLDEKTTNEELPSLLIPTIYIGTAILVYLTLIK